MSGRPNSQFTCLSLPSPSSLPAALSPLMTPVVKFTFDQSPSWRHPPTNTQLKSSLKRPKLDSIFGDRSPSKNKVRFNYINLLSQQISVRMKSKIKMDPTRINWSRRHAEILSENSDIPPDIIFKFLEADDEVSAHKMILALASPVFMKMFFVHNTADRYAQEIVIEHTTKPAFQIMIDAIYDIAPMMKSLQGKSVDEVFAVLYLVNKYEIPELEMAVQNFLSTFHLTDDTVMDVAADVMDYLATFEDEANELLFSCAQYLNSKHTDTESVLRLFDEVENGERLEVIHKLVVLMKDVPPCLTDSDVSSDEETEDSDSISTDLTFDSVPELV